MFVHRQTCLGVPHPRPLAGKFTDKLSKLLEIILFLYKRPKTVVYFQDPCLVLMDLKGYLNSILLIIFDVFVLFYDLAVLS